MSAHEGTKPENPVSPYLTLAEAAAHAPCSIRSIQRYLKAGILTRYSFGSRPLVARSELDRALASKGRRSA